MAVAPLDPVIDPVLTIPFLPQLLAAQADRPWKTHANELATSDIRGVAGLTRLEAGAVLWDGQSAFADSSGYRACTAYSGHLPGIKDDLSETWLDDWAGAGVAEMEALLAKHAAFLSFLKARQES